MTGDGGREVPGTAVGNSGTGAFWSAFLRSLRARGLGSVRLVIAGHHRGLVAAVRKVMPGSACQRCRVHFLRNCFAHIPKGAGEMAAATVRTAFTQPTADQLDAVAGMLGEQFPKVREMLLAAKEDLTAFAVFPLQHWKKIQPANPLERLNRETRRRTDVVQVFPSPGALERLVTAVLCELHDEWTAFPRRCVPEGSMPERPGEPAAASARPPHTNALPPPPHRPPPSPARPADTAAPGGHADLLPPPCHPPGGRNATGRTQAWQTRESLKLRCLQAS
ncbi:transposase [Streptomyces sp. NPDC096030]|uniref:transposase n=1 Tax=Streptomyces sp. NPDC096030 TaxID=3155423 RepID=UPI003316A421